MAMVLETKYTFKGGWRVFLSSRFLRIHPAYWIFLILSLAFYPWFSELNPGPPCLTTLVRNWEGLTTLSKVRLAFTNVFIFGQELGVFLGLDPSKQYLWYRYLGLHFYHPVIQAWSLSHELMFYLLAPFFAGFKKFTVALLVVLLGARMAVTHLGYSYEPVIFRTFPLQLPLFLFGMCVYWLRSHLIIPRQTVQLISIGALFLAVVTYAQWATIEAGDSAAKIALMVFTALLLPTLTTFFARVPVDGFLGHLAYPVYISHVWCIGVTTALLTESADRVLYTLALVLLTSLIVYFLVDRRIDSFRASRFGARPRVDSPRQST